MTRTAAPAARLRVRTPWRHRWRRRAAGPMRGRTKSAGSAATVPAPVAGPVLAAAPACASGSSAYASGYSAGAVVQQTGGAGGLGNNGASGGAGGNSYLTDAVSGRTRGGYLELRQTATGGVGGGSHGANAGQGGAAGASLTFDDTTNPVASSLVNGVSAAYGGNGGEELFRRYRKWRCRRQCARIRFPSPVRTWSRPTQMPPAAPAAPPYGAGQKGGAGGTADRGRRPFASGHSVPRPLHVSNKAAPVAARCRRRGWRRRCVEHAARGGERADDRRLPDAEPGRGGRRRRQQRYWHARRGRCCRGPISSSTTR